MQRHKIQTDRLFNWTGHPQISIQRNINYQLSIGEGEDKKIFSAGGVN